MVLLFHRDFVLVPHMSSTLRHDSLSPLNARFDELVRSWAPLWTSEQIVSGSHVNAGKDRSHDPEHTFAAFVHCEPR
jgi:hypothetical protein